jgi:alkanesulfonate monooxygenase SsuD/methylene tetrahydromethanopterin reductase-like flavin-dependent oxidoreductase (luciferase family)
VGRLADGWLPSFCTPEQVVEGRAIVDEAAAAAGRAIDDEHFGAMVFYARTEIPERYSAISRARGGLDARDLIVVGIAALQDRLEEFVRVGFSKLVLVPVQDSESWKHEIDDIAPLLELQRSLST